MNSTLTALLILSHLAFGIGPIPNTQKPILPLHTVIVTLTDQLTSEMMSSGISKYPALSRQESVIRALQSNARESQTSINSWLESKRISGQVTEITSFWIFNGLAVTASSEIIAEIALRNDVASVAREVILDAPKFIPSTAVDYVSHDANIHLVNAPMLWNLGMRGQNVVVANLDTGVDVLHPDLSAQWRGGTNSWYDPYGEHPIVPVDTNGHGTWTMGVMVGRDASGSTIGIAPDAKWIAAKIFNDHDKATTTGIHLSYQWLLDPDGNPSTADAPQVVNNSWAFSTPGCNLTFLADINALRAAGILPIFAAGNYGPIESSDVSPANNPGVYAVGAVDNLDNNFSESSRGATSCGSPARIYPSLVAPGVGIRTTDLSPFYTYASGTSMAAPHVAGGLALILSKYPGMPLVFQEEALREGAIDLGDLGPDNTYGYGRLDIHASYQWLVTNYYPTLPKVFLPMVQISP